MTDNKSLKEGKKGRLIVFSAPSGAGKTTLLDYLRSCIPELIYSISATTRQPRQGERHGEHYFFLSEEEFKRKIDEEGFAEWMMVHGNYYGTPRSFIDENLDRGADIVMDIDVFGKKKFDAVYPDAVGILIVTPGMDELERRLRKRHSESDEAIERRMTNASVEMNYALCEGKYEYRIINDDLERAKQEILQIVRNIIADQQ
ncbi:MAG: guanylate kinase [Chitinispirillaceae bacterium]|nr:guanylate kinase [Chitinispirillaceae bacterium]